MNGTAYISGPITGYKDFNRPAFRKAKEHLLYYDIFPIDPHDVSEYKPDKTFTDYMLDDLMALLICDYIYLLPGWWHSKGAWLELIVALFCKIKILNFSLPKEKKHG